MKVFLLKDVEKVGIAGEVIKVTDGFGKNFLLPGKLAVEVNAKNEGFYKQREKQVENRKEVISSKTSMLAEKISSIKLVLKRKMHDDGKLYGAISASEIVDVLAKMALVLPRVKLSLINQSKLKVITK